MKQKYKLTARFGPYGYLIPSILVFAVFLFYPFFKTIYLSLFKTNKLGQAKLFVGLQNYKDLLTSASFWNSLMDADLRRHCGGGKHASRPHRGSALQQSDPGNPFFQHFLCPSYGHRLKLCSHDFQDYPESDHWYLK